MVMIEIVEVNMEVVVMEGAGGMEEVWVEMMEMAVEAEVVVVEVEMGLMKKLVVFA